ncbi:MAG: YggS family pyridoxal phosphate-dependent enzyme [Bradymonadia bacterium]
MLSLELVLASASPRRRQLLSGAGFSLSVRPADIDETPKGVEKPGEFAHRMAVEKCQAVARLGDGPWTVAGDTVVALGDRILGKPADQAEARGMLRSLSGETHDVISGWCVSGPTGSTLSGINIAQVRFRKLSEDEIDAYVATGEPMDKAGAYGIQGHGGTLVASYEGDFSSIIGLPLADVIGALSQLSGLDWSDSKQRLAAIQGRIEVAADMADRKPSTVQLIAATKGQSLARLSELVEAGVKHFGESYVAEYLDKRDVIGDAVDWHFIGHLQRNKVRKIVPGINSLHTLSSLRLAEEIDARARRSAVVVPALVQVNLGGETSKSGLLPEETLSLIKDLAAFDHIRIEGLMSIPPREGLARTREWFARLRNLKAQCERQVGRLPNLSMGMSADFDAAILEGATHIRIGSLLCGART